MESVDFYKEFGDLGYLANYSNHEFYEDGVFYKTAEHYYQAHKFDNPEVQKLIIDAKTPKEASNIGRDRKYIRRSDIDSVKNQIMYHGVYLKFYQNKDIMYRLIETRRKPIREMTTKEYYWGVGPDLSGENHMGKILVQVREALKKQLLEKILSKAKEQDMVYVIGHKRPDIDSIFSSYLLSNVLNHLGINSRPCILNNGYEVVENDKAMLKDYKTFDLEVLDSTNYSFILVDHNHLDGLDKENVIGAIDHHMHTNEVDNVLEMEYASTGLLIYDLFKDVYPFSKEEKELIGLTVLTDTEYLTSSRFSEEDELLYDELGLELDVSSLQKKYFKISDFSDFDQLLYSDYKEYDFEGEHINRSIIKSYTDEFNSYFETVKEHIKNKKGIWLVIWNNYESRETFAIFKGEVYRLDFFTTSTNLVLKYLKESKDVKKRT